jgi:multiple sugar transport system substrate-binding protein
MRADYPTRSAGMMRKQAPARSRARQGGSMEERKATLSRRAFLQAMAATGVVVACGTTPSTTPSGSAKPATLSGTVTVSYPDELGAKPKYVTKAADDLKAKYSGLTVNIDLQKIASGDYYTKLLLALSGGGDVPDVIHVGGDRIGELADAGYIEPLDKYVSQWEDWKNYPQAVKDGVSYQGKVWAIPYGLDMRWLYIRRDVMEKAGLGADWTPKNVDDILVGAKAVKDKNATSIPYALYAGVGADTGTANHSFVPLVWAYGGDIIDKSSGKWIGDSPAVRKALDYYQRAYSGGLSPKEILTTTKPWTSMREKEGNGQLALLFEGGWVYGGWQTANKAETEKNVHYVLHPTSAAGPSFTIGGPGTVWFVTAKSKNKDAAWAFIAQWNNKDTVAKLNIEDPHPVARSDSADVAEFKAQPYLVDSTKALEKARFIPTDANYGKVIGAIQKATGRVAAGEMSADDAAKRYTDDLKQAIGADKVITQ